MNYTFYKYQGTGNDFILIDNRLQLFSKNDTKLVARMCDRRFGIGADGLILLEEHPAYDFTMTYYNADGHISSMCGNGGRCIVHFAKFLGIIDTTTVFEAIDGLHEATIKEEQVSLKMKNVSQLSVCDTHTFLNTGSPHHVQRISQIEKMEVKKEGAALRYTTYGKEGANINFCEQTGPAEFSVRTYERGVEDETLSCGTGVTAVALAAFENKWTTATNISLQTPGGKLQVEFTKSTDGYTDIYLKGPAVKVFKGTWE